MIPITSYNNENMAVFGLGESGLAASVALQNGGAEVSAWDDSSQKVEKASSNGVNTSNLRLADWSHFGGLVLSPGVPLTHPAPHWTVEMARESKTEIIGDIELLLRENQFLDTASIFVAVTGTNGKSTTTALIAHILAHANCDFQMGGNIGTPVLSLDPPVDGRVYVLECSTFQIELTPSLKPDVGILLNVTPDHIDRHGTFENYADLKAQLVKSSDLAIIGVDTEKSSHIAHELDASGCKVRKISAEKDVDNGIWIEDGHLHLVKEGQKSHFADLANANSLHGSHNWQNAAAAVLTCLHLGLEGNVIAAALESFPGLAHRMEEVAARNNIAFVNDSKATNAEAAAKALSSFENIYWIVGGIAKSDGLAGLRQYYSRIAKAYLIGESAENFATELKGQLDFASCGALETAVQRAFKDAMASKEDKSVILLSPACASFDQFKSFEHRGESFRQEVFKLLHRKSEKEEV